MYRLKLTDCKHVIGIFCEITRGASPNQRWRVGFMGTHMGTFRTAKQAEQVAAHIVAAQVKLSTQEPAA